MNRRGGGFIHEYSPIASPPPKIISRRNEGNDVNMNLIDRFDNESQVSADISMNVGQTTTGIYIPYTYARIYPNRVSYVSKVRNSISSR